MLYKIKFRKMMRKALKTKLVIGVFFFCSCIMLYSDAVHLKKFTFNEEKGLKGWEAMIVNGKVAYDLMKEGGQGYVRAVSDKACSALYYKVEYKLGDYPVLRWKWKALKFPDKSKVKTAEEKNDYAARVYVVFPFLSFSFSKFIEYIWTQEDMPAGTILDSPIGNNVKMVVVRSGRAGDGEWANDVRNIYDDYIKVFGEKPRREVGAIAIMCDADGTKTSAESLFDDITIEKQLKKEGK